MEDCISTFQQPPLKVWDKCLMAFVLNGGFNHVIDIESKTFMTSQI